MSTSQILWLTLSAILLRKTKVLQACAVHIIQAHTTKHEGLCMIPSKMILGSSFGGNTLCPTIVQHACYQLSSSL